MSAQVRQWQRVSIFNILVHSNVATWRDFITNCERDHDVLGLQKVFYGLQVDMDCLVKEKKVTEGIQEAFCAMTHDILVAFRTILKDQYPNPLDDPIRANTLKTNNLPLYQKHKRDKEAREATLNKWISKIAF